MKQLIIEIKTTTEKKILVKVYILTAYEWNVYYTKIFDNCLLTCWQRTENIEKFQNN